MRPAELRWFLIASGVIALHVIDDNVVQPQPGTSAADHVLSTLVPLAILVAAGCAYGRLRAGWRGLLAISIGFLGAGLRLDRGGLLRVRGRARPETTSPASPRALAGLLLIASGSVILWRSRRRDDRRTWRYSRRLLIAGAAVLVLYELGLAVSLAYMATHVARADVPAADLGTAYEDVTFDDERRPHARRVVRAFRKRRCRHRVRRAGQHPGARADAGRPRIRRAALRPTG